MLVTTASVYTPSRSDPIDGDTAARLNTSIPSCSDSPALQPSVVPQDVSVPSSPTVTPANRAETTLGLQPSQSQSQTSSNSWSPSVQGVSSTPHLSNPPKPVKLLNFCFNNVRSLLPKID